MSPPSPESEQTASRRAARRPDPSPRGLRGWSVSREAIVLPAGLRAAYADLVAGWQPSDRAPRGPGRHRPDDEERAMLPLTQPRWLGRDLIWSSARPGLATHPGQTAMGGAPPGFAASEAAGRPSEDRGAPRSGALPAALELAWAIELQRGLPITPRHGATATRLIAARAAASEALARRHSTAADRDGPRRQPDEGDLLGGAGRAGRRRERWPLSAAVPRSPSV
jgi:hypothetical protein